MSVGYYYCQSKKAAILYYGVITRVETHEIEVEFEDGETGTLSHEEAHEAL